MRLPTVERNGWYGLSRGAAVGQNRVVAVCSKLPVSGHSSHGAFTKSTDPYPLFFGMAMNGVSVPSKLIGGLNSPVPELEGA